MCKGSITGFYILQSNRAVFIQCVVNPTCRLCSDAPETRKHLDAECVLFKTGRYNYIRKLLNISTLQGVQIAKIEYPEFSYTIELDVKLEQDYLETLELYIREFISKVHVKRTAA